MILMFLFRTSSTSVEQARERSYHRALLLSKDKDTGENNRSHSHKKANKWIFKML